MNRRSISTMFLKMNLVRSMGSRWHHVDHMLRHMVQGGRVVEVMVVRNSMVSFMVDWYVMVYWERTMIMNQRSWVNHMVDVGSVRVVSSGVVSHMTMTWVTVYLVVFLVYRLVGSVVHHTMAHVVGRGGDGHVVTTAREGGGVGEVGRRPTQGREEGEVRGGWKVVGGW